MAERPVKLISERQFHVQTMDWLRLSLHPDVVVNHAPIEGRRGFRARSDLHDLGYYTGWPDIELIWKFPHFLELKSATGYLSPAQRACHDHLRRAGAKVEVAQTLDEVRYWLGRWAIPTREGVRLT
jgi:hypothetical protein